MTENGRWKTDVRSPRLNSLRSSSSKPWLNKSKRLVELGKNLTPMKQIKRFHWAGRGPKSEGKR